MKIRAVQFSPVLGNVEKNLEFHADQIESAINAGVDLIVFPELSLTGYDLKDLVFEVALAPDNPIIEKFKKWSTRIKIVIGAPVEEIPGIITNSALYFADGEWLHHHQKVQLPNFGMFQEAMIFKPGAEFRSFPLGEFTAGLLICREILFPMHAYLYYLQGVDLLIGISNSPYRNLGADGFISHRLWEIPGYNFSVFFHQHYLFVNRSGIEDGLGFGGGSYFARSGKDIDTLAKYYEADSFDVVISRDEVRRARLSGNYLRDEKPELILKEMKRILDA